MLRYLQNDVTTPRKVHSPHVRSNLGIVLVETNEVHEHRITIFFIYYFRL